MDRLSPSKINKWYQCGFSFFCDYIAHKPTIKTPDSALFGQMIHNIAVNYYDKIDDSLTLDQVNEKVEEAFVEGADYRLFEGHKQDLKKNQEAFKSWETDRIKKKIKKPSLIEKPLIAELFPDLPPIEGRIDFYMGDVQLWGDWKTGHYEEMTPDRMVQGKIYELLLIANGYPVKGGVFVNLTKNIVHPFPKVTNGWLESRIRTMVNKVEKGIFPVIPSGLCQGWCGFKNVCDLRGICPWRFDMES